MPEFVQGLIQRVEGLGPGAYWLLAVIVFLETIVGIGHFLPGALVTAFFGFLCYGRVFDFGDVLWCVFGAHYSGEIVNYYLGRHGGRSLFRHGNRYLKPALLEAAEQRFSRGAARIIILTQFVGFLRPFIPFVAGVARYRLLKFLPVMAVGAFLYSLVHVGAGFVLGASWQKAVVYLGDFALLALILLVTLPMAGWVVRRIGQHAGELALWLESASRRIHRSEAYRRIAMCSPRLFGFLESRLSLTRRWGISASLGLAFSLLFAFLFVLLLRNVGLAQQHYLTDVRVVSLIAELRQGVADSAFLFVTQFGGLTCIVVMTMTACILCAVRGQYRALAMIVSAVVMSFLLVNLVKLVAAAPRPDPAIALVSVEGSSFPSSHAAMSLALLGSLAWWVWCRGGAAQLRLGSIFVILVLVLLCGFSRIYLGVHYPSDVLAGHFLAAAILFVSGTVAGNSGWLREREGRATIPVAVVLAAGVVAAALAPVRTGRVETRPAGGRVQTDCGTTRTLLAQVPRGATRLSGRPTLPVNIVLLGDASTLVKELGRDGWRWVPPSAFLMQEIRAPIFPAFTDGLPASYTLEQGRQTGRMVVRLWTSRYTLLGRPVWVGAVVQEEIVRNSLGVAVYRVSPDLDFATDRFCSVLHGPSVEMVSGFRARGLYEWKRRFFTHGSVALISVPASP